MLRPPGSNPYVRRCYLNKPVLMVPTHIEQACNAYDASLSGAGVVADCLIWTCYYPFRKVMWRIRSSGIG